MFIVVEGIVHVDEVWLSARESALEYHQQQWAVNTSYIHMAVRPGLPPFWLLLLNRCWAHLNPPADMQPVEVINTDLKSDYLRSSSNSYVTVEVVLGSSSSL